MEKLQIENLEDVKITSMSHYAVHFKVKDESYLYHNNSEYQAQHQLRRKIQGQRKTEYMMSEYGDFHGVKKLKTSISQPNNDDRVIRKLVKRLEQVGFADTPLKKEVQWDRNAEIIKEIKKLELDIQRLKESIVL